MEVQPLSVPDQHQLKVARDTLKMPDAMVDIIGGMSKTEARQVVERLTGKLNRQHALTQGQ